VFPPFVTGSWAYGEPRPDSDIDVVVLCTDQELTQLVHRYPGLQTLGSSDNSAVDEDREAYSLRVHDVNLLATNSPKVYECWLDGTRALTLASPVTREGAVAVFKALRTARGLK
jgi:predicted nucleotidyltransferase